MEQTTPKSRPTSPAARVLVMPVSTRTASLNQALGRLITERLRDAGDRAALIDLAEYPMPMYNGDIEQHDGVPEPAGRLVELVKAAEVLILVSPEYNGSFPALLKNTYDWMSRIDRRCLAGMTVMLASAAPGERGGRRGLDMLATFMNNVHADVPDLMLAAGSLSLDADGAISGLDDHQVAEFIDHAVAAARTSRRS